MLQYFPTPYPDELWYSVLGRYHVRSGNPNSATTLRELFGAESVGGMGNFLPNCGIRRVAEKLPEGVLDARKVALHHTLFPYTFRFQDLSTKEKLLEQALNEKVPRTGFFHRGRQSRPRSSEPPARLLSKARNLRNFPGEPHARNLHAAAEGL